MGRAMAGAFRTPVRQVTMTRWSLPPYGPLAAAVVASRNGYWADAIALWRDVFRVGDHDRLAAASIAEAALHFGHQGLVDHMLAQLDPLPDYLKQLAAADRATAAQAGALADYGGDLEKDVAAFRSEHPLGGSVPDMRRAAPRRFETRPLLLARLFGGGVKTTQVVIEGLCSRRDETGLRVYTEQLLERGASPAHLHWAIAGLHKLGVGLGDPLLHRAMTQFSVQDLAQEERAITDARLARALGYPGFARIILLRALSRSRRATARAAIRRRLAALVAECGRWLDDGTILSAADFAMSTPARATLLDHVRSRASGTSVAIEGKMAEPVELAFDWLLERGLEVAEPYTPENRLLMVGNTLGCGGMERMMARAYRHFADGSDFDRVDLALLDYEDGAPSAFCAEEAGISARDIVLLGPGGDAAMPFALLPPTWNIRAHKLHAHIRDTRPRVVHAWNDLTGLLAAFTGMVAGCPKIVVHFHHTPNVPLSGRVEPIASYPAVYRKLRTRHNLRTVFCAEAAARGYAEWWRVPRDERFRVLYNGFDWQVPAIEKAQAKDAIGLAGDRPVMGTVLRFSEVKQPLLWAEAAIALAKDASEAQFLMVGDGPLRQAVADRIAEAGLAASLHMPGQVENVPDYLAAMDLFWLTSRTEGLPNVLIEAQFSGVPIVAFDVGGIGETFVEGETGILVPPNDIAELTQRSLALLRDLDWRDAASSKALAQAEARFSSGAFFEGLRNLY